MGAWIEIMVILFEEVMQVVAPLVGAWIEITGQAKQADTEVNVAPLVGAWIEIHFIKSLYTYFFCRSSRGSVD